MLSSMSTTPGTTLPAGCTSTAGYSPITGQKCDSGVTVTLPAGCTSTSGYSPITGQKCDSGVTTPTTPVTGTFTVSLAPTSPASGTLIQGQSTADLAHYTFSNGTVNPVKVTSITLNRTGVSSDATLANVYLFDGAVRLTDAATVSGGTVTYNNPNGIFTIPANSTKTIAVKSDIAGSTSGQTVGVSLTSIVSDGTLSSSLPIAGNIHTIASADLASVTIGAAQPANSPSSSTTTDPTSDVRIWESTFTVNTRNVQFTRLALRQINSIDSADIGNFRLLIDGVEVASVASLDPNGYVTFIFDKVLTTGARNVKVIADITGGSSRAIQMSLRNKADVELKDVDYGVNVSATIASGTADDIVVNSGALPIIANNADLPVTVANGASNVLIGKWTFKATGEAVKVETLKAGFTYTETSADNAAASLRNGKIMINGAQAGSTATLEQNGTEYSVNYTFQPGVETVVELYADIYDNNTTQTGGIVAGDKIQGKLIAGTDNATLQTSLGVIGVPNSNSNASQIVVDSGSATLVATSSYGNQSVVIPQQTPFKIGSWTMTAGTAEDINVSGLSFAIAGTDGDDGDAIASFTVDDMYDMYATYQIGSGSVVSTNVITSPTALTTYSTSFTLPKGQTVKIELYSKLEGTVSTNDTVQATLTVSGTGAQSGATANSSAIPGQVITAKEGVLNVSLDASTPDAALVTGARDSVRVASYKLEAVNDSYTISQLTVTLTGPSAIKNVYLQSGSTVLASTSAISDSVIFNLATPITIPANSSKIIDIVVDLNTIGAGAGATGSNVSADLDKILQRPGSTGTATTGDLSGLAGKTQYVYKSIPTVSLSQLDNTKLTAGTNVIQKFNISADSKGSIAWKAIDFNINKSATTLIAGLTGSVTAGTIVGLYDGITLIPGTFTPSADLGSGATSGSLRFIATNEQQIAAGAQKTYELKVNITGVGASGTHIMSNIANDTIQNGGIPVAYASVPGSSKFVWSDMSAQGHSETTSDWTNGYLVKNLPLNTQTLTVSN